MGKIGESLLYVVVGIAVIGLFMFFPSFKSTGNVVADSGYNAKVGDALNYNLTISVPEGKGDAGTPILISLSKNGEILGSKIVNLEDFVKLSDNNPGLGAGQTVPSGIYVANVNNLINYNFNQTGEYELYYAIFKLDVVKIIKITVG